MSGTGPSDAQKLARLALQPKRPAAQPQAKVLGLHPDDVKRMDGGR
jgi:hypothetical protein